MEKINFINNQAPALNATNLNQLQTNIETAINEVVESGSNSNGNYIKFSDGTMICWMQETVTNQAINNAYGSLFQGARQYTFPVPFIGNVTAKCTIFQYGTSASWGTASSFTNSVVTLRGFDVFSREAGENCKIGYMAIGKWK